jgi:hypothetical protein
MRPTVRLLSTLLLACSGAAIILSYAQARQTTVDQTCLSNLKQINLGLLMYVQDYDETLPPMKTTAKTQFLLNPYLKNNSLFTCPATGAAYKLNTALSSKKMATISAPATVPTFYDAKPHADGKYRVGYLDGHVKVETKAPVIKPASKPGSKKN